MPQPSSVESIHRHLKAYCAQEAPLLLLRYQKIEERCTDLVTENGAVIRWTDNSPAWEMHHAAFQGFTWTTAEFDSFVRSIPCKMFAVKNGSINKNKWYVAHIFPVKADRRAAIEMTHSERVARFVRNVHPANHFYFPNPARRVGMSYGESREVIQYVAAYYRKRYASIWQDFLRLAMAQDFLTESAGSADLHVDLSQGIIDLPDCRSAEGHSVAMNTANTEVLCIQVEGDCLRGDLNWTGNDSSQRNNSALVPAHLVSATLRLCWRATKDSPKKLIGCYRLNLAGLEAAAYIRKESNSANYRVRIVHESDNYLYLQLNSTGPRIPLGRFV